MSDHPSPPARHGGTEPIRPHWIGRGADTGFGRLFPDLAPLRPPRDKLIEVSESMLDSESEPSQPGWGTQDGTSAGDNPGIQAGMTYFGQFVDHDVTFDVGSRLDRHASELGNAPFNFRTPRLDIDSVYGGGPTAQPYLYETDGEHFRLGTGTDDQPDLLRLPAATNGLEIAVVPEPRNDENRVVSQIHSAVQQQHNQAVDETSDFAQARNEVTVRYQRAIVEDFLPAICGADLVAVALRDGPGLLPPPFGQFIPVEFAGAAYRFGHSQVRPRYQIVAGGPSFPVFAQVDGEDDLRGGRRLSAEHRITDHQFWFGADTPQKTRLIDRNLAGSLFDLFGAADPAQLPYPNAGIARNLAARNLERGVVLGLPSGEDIHAAMAARNVLVTPLTDDQLEEVRATFWGEVTGPGTEKTPLWGWVLTEAQVLHGGRHLGPVGATIVAHTIIGLLYADPRSRIRSAGWHPGGGGTVLGFLTGA